MGQEVRTTTGDLIGLYLEQPIRPGLSPAETAPAIHEQGGLVGLAHPFDRFRSGAGRKGWEGELERVIPALDYVEARNARAYRRRRQPPRAAEFAKAARPARRRVVRCPHVMELGVAYTVLDGPDRHRRASFAPALAAGPRLVTCARLAPRSAWACRFAKVVQRLRGNNARERALEHGMTGDLRSQFATPERSRRGDPRLPARPRGERAAAAAVAAVCATRARSSSIVLPILVLSSCWSPFPGFHLDQLPSLIAQANPWLLLAAVRHLLPRLPAARLSLGDSAQGAGNPIRVTDSTEIIFISWLVNCLVPAKLGDVYRAYLLQGQQRPSAEQAPSARSSSSASSTSSRSCCWASLRASGASARACRPRSS